MNKQSIREQISKDQPKPKKFRKKRKPMSPEQKAAAVERLAKAREKRMQENPPEYKSIHPDVLKLDDDDNLSLKNVRSWIKTQKELLSSYKRDERAGIKGATAKVAATEGYIRNLQRYIQTGTYLDMFWGEHAQNRMKQVCLVMAYYPCGTPKRNHGTYYADIGMEWDSLTMNEFDYTPEKPKKQKPVDLDDEDAI